MEFSDYIVYVDESGDANLKNKNLQYPLFVFAFCIFDKKEYSEIIDPKIKKLKFKYFGHDSFILHEIDIRKNYSPFNIFKGKINKKKEFIQEIDEIIKNSNVNIIAAAVDKIELTKKYSSPYPPDELSLKFCIERLARFLKNKGQTNKMTYIIAEKRGPKEDSKLELEFRRICDDDGYEGKIDYLDIIFVDKKANSAGLQFADMVARPIGLSVIKPKQSNRAFETIRTKIYNSKRDGLKIFP